MAASIPPMLKYSVVHNFLNSPPILIKFMSKIMVCKALYFEVQYPLRLRSRLSYIQFIDKINILSKYTVGQPVKNVLLSEKKTFSMNSQYINWHNQSTVETVTTIWSMFFKQKSKIKHMHPICVVVEKICIYLLEVLCPRQHKKRLYRARQWTTRTVLGRA